MIVNLFSGAEVALSERQRHFTCNVCSPHGFLIRKIAFSEAPTSSSCIMAAMTNTCRVAVCKVGCPEYGWMTYGCQQKGELKDIAFCNGELYGITSYGDKLFRYDIALDDNGAPVISAAHLLVSQRYNSPTRWSFDDESVVYLIELRCKLVMAVRAKLLPPGRETSFNLFEVVNNNADGYRWVEMKSLDDHALFVGPKCSMAVQVPVGGRHGVQRNIIYYSNHRSFIHIESFSDAVYLTRTDLNDPMYRRQDKRGDDEIRSIGYYVRDGPYTPTWLFPPVI
jgi:hypothetical protein